MQRTQTAARAETVPVLRVVVAKEGGQTGTFELTKNVVRFGRSPECDVRLEGKNISRVHCILEARADGLWIRDNDSLNGIFLNGEKVKEAILTSRDAVKVGAYRFKAIIAGTMPMSAKQPEPPRAAVPAAAPEMDRTLTAIETKKAEERPSSSTGPILEDFIAAAKAASSDDRTPAEGMTPVAGSPVALRAEAPVAPARPANVPPPPAPVKLEQPAKLEQPKAEAPRSLRSSFENATRSAKVELEEKPKEIPAPVAPRPLPPARPMGRISLTQKRVSKNSSGVRPGDLCSSCATGRMLTWEGALKCRTCGNTAELGGTASAKVEAREARQPREITNTRAPSVVTKVSTPAPAAAAGEARLGEVCQSCFKGRMYTWEGGLRCRSCGNRGENLPLESKSASVATPSLSKPASKAVSFSTPAEEREPRRGVAVVLGLGLFFGLYATIGGVFVLNLFL